MGGEFRDLNASQWPVGEGERISKLPDWGSWRYSYLGNLDRAIMSRITFGEFSMSRFAIFSSTLGFWLSLAGVVGIILSPLGFRLGLWDFAFALRKVLAGATLSGIAGFVLCLLAMVVAKMSGVRFDGSRAWIGLLIGGVFAGYVLLQLRTVKSLPMIHDITTDTTSPPTFVALADARKAAPNGIEYKGAEIANQQMQAYPDLAPHVSKLPPAQLFAKAESAARAAGWDIAAADVQVGRIEATVTSLIYGFKDDMVIRVTPAASGSQLDMRSMSRMGTSDVGMNAKRIREFVASLKAAGV